jgi:hypothetical protein
MTGEQEYAGPDVNDMHDYIQHRSRILKKAYDDHVRWETELKATRGDVGVAAVWFDQDGERHVDIINEAYMATHWKMIRSLILDLADCGPEGQDAVRRLVPAKLMLPAERETSEPGI